MHPAYKSDRPGVAPDCGMKLEPVYEGDPATDPTKAGLLKVSAEKQQLIGVEYGTVELASSSSSFQAVGKVTQDDTRGPNPFEGGRLDRAGPRRLHGRARRESQPLLTIYSPEMLAT